jgi:hypothetical protein
MLVTQILVLVLPVEIQWFFGKQQGQQPLLKTPHIFPKSLQNCSLDLETQRPAKMFIGRNMRGGGPLKHKKQLFMQLDINILKLLKKCRKRRFSEMGTL